MIIKNKEEREQRSANEKKGDAAESQMAFYLRRYFSDNSEIHVLNDVYLTLKGEVAQIDHLVITPYRLWIIESKSVSGRLVIQDDGQWIKRFEEREFGFASPVLQATLQAKILLGNYRKYFNFFNRQPLKESILVAVSSDCVIEDQRTQRGDVLKADLVPNRILQVYEQDKGVADVMPWGVYRAMADECATYFLIASEVCKKAKLGVRLPDFTIASEVCKKAKLSARLPDDVSNIISVAVAATFAEMMQAIMDTRDIPIEISTNPEHSWWYENDSFKNDFPQQFEDFVKSQKMPKHIESMCCIAGVVALQEKANLFWDNWQEKSKAREKEMRDLIIKNASAHRKLVRPEKPTTR